MSDEPEEAPDVEELVRAAAREVDRALIQWALSFSPLDRLRASMRSAASLQAFRDAKSRVR
ncbi:MAG TPA: hypothetical protein VFG22_13560 [Polyangiales bacterium]|nr:hypothetical protein [Polyangiales bacterium]